MFGRTRLKTIAATTAAIFLNFTLLTSVAYAQNGRTIAAFVLPKNSKQRQAAAVMSSILREQMSKLVGVSVRTGAPAGNAQAAIESERLVNAGFTALNTGDKAGAVQKFQQSWDVLAQNPGVGNIRLHARVAKGLGVASFMTGQTTRGKELIKRSLLLYPRQKANEYAWTVDVRNIYEHAKREITEQATGNIEVRSTPEGAEVYLDGAFKGYTPITLQQTAAGSHLVEVVKDGYLRWSTAALVPPGGRVPTEAVLTASPVKRELKTAIDKVSRSMRSSRFGKAAEQLQGVVDANETLVVTAAVAGGGFALSGFYRDIAGGVHPVEATIAQDAQFFANIRGLLTDTLKAAFAAEERAESLGAPPAQVVESVMKESQSLGGDIVIDPNSPLFQVEEKEQGEKITDKWWFWTIVGAGTLAVAGTVVGVVLATSGDDGPGGAVGNLSITLEQF